MNYLVDRDGTTLGSYSDEQLRAALGKGELCPTDMARCEGMDRWLPLSAVLQLPAPVPAAPPPARTYFMARAALILGIFSLSCFTALPAIICGGVALELINSSNGRLKGRGMAIAGIWLGIVFGIASFVFAASWSPPGVQEKARQIKAADNARQIIIALKAYAADHNGHYPDADESHPFTSNDAFRLLFIGGYVKDERLFTAPASPFVGDTQIGTPPDFAQALEADENHWCLMTGLTTASDPHLPLVFECPNDKSWPPTWNADVAGQAKQGRCWKGGKIIVGRNDGSANVEKLEAVRGDSVTTLTNPDGTNLFDRKKPREYLTPQH